MKNGLLTGFCMLALGAAAAQAPKLDDYDWYDGTQLTIEGTAFTDGETPYCRLPKSAQGRVPNPVWSMSHHATGVNVRFVPQGRRLMFKWVVDNPRAVDAFMGPTAMTGLDVYRQEADGTWKFAANPRYFYYQKDAQGNEHGGEYAMNWEPGRPCMVYLPLRSTVRSFKVGIEKGAKIEALPRHPVARRIVHYGTSIVHGGCVSRPGMAFAVQEGRLADVEVINHGYSGAGKMEMDMCEMIASIDAALYVLDCDWNMSVEMQKQNYEPFVRRSSSAAAASSSTSPVRRRSSRAVSTRSSRPRIRRSGRTSSSSAASRCCRRRARRPSTSAIRTTGAPCRWAASTRRRSRRPWRGTEQHPCGSMRAGRMARMRQARPSRRGNAARRGYFARRAYFFSTTTLKKRCCGVASVHGASESAAFPFSTARYPER